MSELLYFMDSKGRNVESIRETLIQHDEVKFVSLVAIDLGNNHTDEKIPVEAFLEDVKGFLQNGVQTDGSSVNLPEIAEINNAKVDIIPDTDVKWLVDYNYDYIESNGKPVGTLLIPSFLKHDEMMVGSRSILKKATQYFEESILDVLKNNPKMLEEVGTGSIDEIESVSLTMATELEFWVKTPDHRTDIEKLSTSQTLKEQYWKRTVGSVRTALEQSLIALNNYGFEAEMGHKEVGGVTAKLAGTSQFSHVMEQLEVDWKYSNPLQSSDHELFAKDIITDIFVRNGLIVTFLAKPVDEVAGNGEHHHVGAALKLKNGKLVNLLAPQNFENEYLNTMGWGALMGLLKNYEVINPFVTSTNDSFKRLKPGFEAPVCIVGSIGHTAQNPSRNRTVLAGLVRDMNSPMATRFELRSPNPTTNSYLTTAAVYQAMLDGIKAASASGLSTTELEKEFSKDAGTESFYLEKDRAYRSEEDVFEHYSDEERSRLFATPPSTVWENVRSFDLYPEKMEVLKAGDVFTDKILSSYKSSIQNHWTTELRNRIIPTNSNLIRRYSKIHGIDDITDIDVVNWEKINALRYYLMKNSLTQKSLFTSIGDAIEDDNFELVSKLQVEMMDHMSELTKLYINYKHNLIRL